MVFKLGEFREGPKAMSTKLKSKEISGQFNQLDKVSENVINSLSNLIDDTMDNPQPSSCPKGGEGSETRDSILNQFDMEKSPRVPSPSIEGDDIVRSV